MKLPTSFATALLIGSSLAVPSRLAERTAARSSSRQSQPMQRILEDNQDTPEFRQLSQNVQYSHNWAGAVWENPPPEGPFYAVSGTFTVPDPKAVGKPSGGTTAGSAWIGIDGDTYGAAILQAGVDFYVKADGKTSFDAWYEWYPDYAYDFEMSIAAGDVISIWVQSYSSSEGDVYIENQTTGETASQQLKAPSEKSKLAGQNAEWIVEDFQSGGELVSLVDFGTVTFTDAQAQAGESEKIIPVKGATTIELKQSDKVYTQTTIKEDTVLDVKYTG